MRQLPTTVQYVQVSWPILYSKLLYKIGQDFLDTQYDHKKHDEGLRENIHILSRELTGIPNWCLVELPALGSRIKLKTEYLLVFNIQRE